MRGIGEFFKKIQEMRLGDVAAREIIRNAIKKNTSLDIPVDSITLSLSTATIKGLSQAGRSEIFIKKEAIMSDINSGNMRKKITDIRYS